ncbi:helix-loop-helix DNA-binding domain-containing protein [Scheffersomyces amazonensis]|uniref:helix-loop-helix DNA-binding domain-containing protein n=1 Tax=Scheffersomyces amazonensis TaxID=1078765 RepID=UPI00315D80ED
MFSQQQQFQQQLNHLQQLQQTQFQLNQYYSNLQLPNQPQQQQAQRIIHHSQSHPMIQNMGLSPSMNGSNQANDQWLDDLLTKSAPITTTNSFTELSTPSGVQDQQLKQLQQQQLSQLGATLDFTKYFDDEIDSDGMLDNDDSPNAVDGDAAYLSSSTSGTAASDSLQTSPVVIKTENIDDEVIPELKLSKFQTLNDFTSKNLESIFDTKDILKDENNNSNTLLSRRKTIDSNFSNNSSTKVTSNNSEIDNQVATPAPKKKRRAPRKRLTDSQKQAHNKIEKKYRININAKIAGLQQIIPWVAYEKTAFETGQQDNDEEMNSNCARLNKSIILEKAIDYILYLQKNEKKIISQNQLLKSEVVRLGGDASRFD